jgi:hypothetical protein
VTDKLASLAVDLPESFWLIVTPYKPDPKDQHSPLPQVALDQLCVVHHVLHGWNLDDPVMLVTAENAGNMAKGTRHTRCTCLKGPDKDKWMEAELYMLDKNDSYGIYVLMIVQSLGWLRFYSFAKPAVLLDYSLEVR